MAICCATMTPHPGSDQFSVDTIVKTSPDLPIWPTPRDIPLALSHAANPMSVYIKYNTSESNTGVVGSYQLLYESATEDILAFLHDDVLIRENDWDVRILQAMEDETIGVCGFGGALQHGDSDLYKRPYRLNALRRHHYRSNVDDAETHGERFTGDCGVAVLDGYALICRRTFLQRIGGWAWIPPEASFYCYDYALCAMARRLDYRVHLIGIRCHHRGGSASVSQDASVREITSPENYDKAHWWFYDEFRNVMPAVVKL